ncbi:MAG TPA: histidine phosphatase family protein, partial [Planctomycetota bacterium]|nr:histidine phosphatase family protein [Planctomycetota bacterium]
MPLYLVRHGQTAWNELGRAQGHTDIPLDERGRRQAQALGEAFRRLPLDRILTSDLARAYQTAEAVAHATGVSLEVRPELRERGFGEWEGSPFADVGAWILARAQSDGIPFLECRPPGGEAFADVWTRLD